MAELDPENEFKYSIADLIQEGRKAFEKGDQYTARMLCLKAIEETKSRNEPEKLPSALLGLAFLEFYSGAYLQARELAEQALNLAANDSIEQVRAWNVLGNCAMETNSLDRAEAYYHQARDLARRLGAIEDQVRLLHNLGNGVHFLRGQIDLAINLEWQSYHLAREHGLDKLVFRPLITIAWISIIRGEFPIAKQAIEELKQIEIPMMTRGYVELLDAQLMLEQNQLELDASPTPQSSVNCRCLWRRRIEYRVQTYAQRLPSEEGGPWNSIHLGARSREICQQSGL